MLVDDEQLKAAMHFMFLLGFALEPSVGLCMSTPSSSLAFEGVCRPRRLWRALLQSSLASWDLLRESAWLSR